MRPDDLARLNEPYPEPVEPTDADARAAISVNLPHWTALEDEIFSDFTEQPPYGIGWWAPDPGTSRRILISDQLHCCLESVAANMTEAALHWLEYLGASDRDSARLADAVKITRRSRDIPATATHLSRAAAPKWLLSFERLGARKSQAGLGPALEGPDAVGWGRRMMCSVPSESAWSLR